MIRIVFGVLTLFFTLFTITLIPSHAQDPIELRIHHFLGPQSGTHKDMLVPWAKDLEEASKGALNIKIFPSMTLGGKPQQLYKQARDGVVDIVWTLAGYTPGQFPRTEVFELPFVHTNDAIKTNKAIWSLYESDLAADYQGIKPLAIHVHMGQSFHLRDTQVKTIADLKGLTIRTPNRVGGWYLNHLGATPIAMPVPSLPEALSKGVVKGALIPFEVSLPLRIPEIAQHTLLGDQDKRFGTAVFLMLMNEKSFEALPPSLQALINDKSGDNLSKFLGQLWQDNELKGMKAYEEQSKPITRLSQEAMQPFEEAAQKTYQQWFETVSPLGIDGQALLKKAQKAIQQ